MAYLVLNPKKQEKAYISGSAMPSLESIHLIATNTEILVQFSIQYLDTEVEWLTPSGDIDGNYILFSINGDAIIDLELNNLNSLSNGIYNAKVNFTVNSLTYSHTIKLMVSGVTGITTDKPIYQLVYDRSDNTLSGDTEVDIVGNTDDLPLKFWQNSVIFEPAENFTEEFIIEDNSTNPIASNTNLPTTGEVSIPSRILKMDGSFVYAFTTKLIIVDGNIVVLPTSLEFEVFKGEDVTKQLQVANPYGLNFEITTLPIWLSASALTGNTSTSIGFTTISASLAAGEYEGDIVFTCDDQSITINVTLIVKEFIIIDDSSDFCLDIAPVIVNKKNESATFVNMLIEVTYEVLNEIITLEIPCIQPYFENQAKFELGQKLHRHFPRIKRELFNYTDDFLAKKIIANITVQELSADKEVLLSENITGLKFFPGKKPKAFPLLSNFLHRKINPSSLYFNSVVSEDIITLEKDEARIEDSPLIFDDREITLYEFPKVFSPIHVQWENQNLMPEWFTFTGEYEINPEYNHIYARNIFNAQNEKYDFTKVKTLVIDTGFHLKAEKPLIEEMIDSKISFMEIEGKIYRCFNITKKYTTISSSEELISSSLEYLIVEQQWK